MRVHVIMLLFEDAIDCTVKDVVEKGKGSEFIEREPLSNPPYHLRINKLPIGIQLRHNNNSVLLNRIGIMSFS